MAHMAKVDIPWYKANGDVIHIKNYGVLEIRDYVSNTITFGDRVETEVDMAEEHWGCKGYGKQASDKAHAPECMNPPKCEASYNGEPGPQRQWGCSETGRRYKCSTYKKWYCWTCHEAGH